MKVTNKYGYVVEVVGTGKRPKKFTYTYQDIATITGLQVHTVINKARTKWKVGEFDPKDLKSTVQFIMKYL